MTDTPFHDLLDEWLTSRYLHAVDMELAMRWTECLIGVPYGPAPCEVHPSRLRGIIDGGPAVRLNREQRRRAR